MAACDGVGKTDAAVADPDPYENNVTNFDAADSRAMRNELFDQVPRGRVVLDENSNDDCSRHQKCGRGLLSADVGEDEIDLAIGATHEIVKVAIRSAGRFDPPRVALDTGGSLGSGCLNDVSVLSLRDQRFERSSEVGVFSLAANPARNANEATSSLKCFLGEQSHIQHAHPVSPIT